MSKRKSNKLSECEFENDTIQSNVYTYIGQGEDPPRKINFMGMQEFVRGVPTEVTNDAVLAKIATNPCFVYGGVDMDSIHEQDEEAVNAANAQREADKATNAAFHKKYKTDR